MLDDIRNRSFVVGTKQTLKAIENRTVSLVYLAEDASDYMKQQVSLACEGNKVELKVVPSMKQLGNSCGISRGAVTAAIIKQ